MRLTSNNVKAPMTHMPPGWVGVVVVATAVVVNLAVLVAITVGRFG